MDSLNHDNQADVIEAFNSTSRYLDDLLNIDNLYFEGMVNQIYPPELQLNKVNISDTEAPFLDLHLSVANGFVSSKIYDKRDDFDFDIVNFPFLDGDVPRRASYGVYVLRKVGIGAIPELHLRKVGIPTLSANSRIVPVNSRIVQGKWRAAICAQSRNRLGQSRNSYFAQEMSGTISEFQSQNYIFLQLKKSLFIMFMTWVCSYKFL